MNLFGFGKKNNRNLLVLLTVMAFLLTCSSCVEHRAINLNASNGASSLQYIDSGVFGGTQITLQGENIPNIPFTEYGFRYTSNTPGKVNVFLTDPNGKVESTALTLPALSPNKAHVVKVKLQPTRPNGVYTLAVRGGDGSSIVRTFNIGNFKKELPPKVNDSIPENYSLVDNSSSNPSPAYVFQAKGNVKIDQEIASKCKQSEYAKTIREYQLTLSEQSEYKNACSKLFNGEIDSSSFEMMELQLRLAAKKRIERSRMTPQQLAQAQSDDVLKGQMDKMMGKAMIESFGDMSEQFFGTRSVYDSGDGKSKDSPTRNKNHLSHPLVEGGSGLWYAWRGKLLGCKNNVCFILASKDVAGGHGKTTKIIDVFAFDASQDMRSHLQIGAFYLVTGKYVENVKYSSFAMCSKLSECTVKSDMNILDYE
ncbi:hypothetical protein [Solidesulfovibrio sp.]